MHIVVVFFPQNTVDSGLWVPPENQLLASVRHHRDILLLAVGCHVRHDRRVAHPSRSRCGSTFR